MPLKRMKNRKTISVAIDEQTQTELYALAQRTDVAASNIVRRAVKKYLKDRAKRRAAHGTSE